MPHAYKKLFARAATVKAIDRTVKQLLPDWVTVFMLHRLEVPELGIHGLGQQYLRDCLQYLRNSGFEFISLEEAIKKSLANELEKKKWVSFSIDDGYFEQVSVAGEIFHEFDCPATYFLITDFIDRKLWPWDHKLVYIMRETRKQHLDIAIDGQTYKLDLSGPNVHRSAIDLIRKKAAQNAYRTVGEIADIAEVEIPSEPPATFQPTTWEKVREMEGKGLHFAPHSVTHRIMARLSEQEIQEEIDRSMARIQQECANPVNVFCYPSGKSDEFDERAVKYLREKQFAGAFSAEPGYLSGPKMRNNPNYRFAIPRMTIPENFTEFKLYVSWAQYVRENLPR